MSTQTYGCIGLEFPILLDRRVVEQHKGWPINIVLNCKPGKVGTVWCSGKEVGCTGKSLSEALIFASTKPQYNKRLFIELQVQYMKIPNSNLGRTCCEQKLFLKFRTILYTTCSPHVMQKRRASDKNLPLTSILHIFHETEFIINFNVLMEIQIIHTF